MSSSAPLVRCTLLWFCKAQRKRLVHALVLCSPVLFLWACDPGVVKPKSGQTNAAERSQVVQEIEPNGYRAVRPGIWFGFRERELLERQRELITLKDRKAWAQLLSQGLASGVLVSFKPGDVVFLERTAMVAGAVKVRRKGETTSWWITLDAVK